jgi:hypothetical protein
MVRLGKGNYMMDVLTEVSETKKRRNESGNVIFLILIAVALFAALSYVVTNSSRSGGDDLREKENLAASEILNYIVSVRSGVLRMLISGVPVDKLSSYTPNRISNDGSPNLYDDNPACTSDNCRVFSPVNGVVYKSFVHHGMAVDSSWPAGEQGPGENDIVLINVEGIGTEANDVALRIVNITPRICNAINLLYNGRPMFGWSVEEGGNPLHLSQGVDNPAVRIVGEAAGMTIIPYGDASRCFFYAVIVER